MAGARTASSKAKDQGTALELAVARDRQCDFLCHAVRLRLAAAARGLPPWSTVYRQFAAWRDGCVFERINHALVIVDRERVGREASPSAAIIDSQSVKTTEAGGLRGYDAGKKVNERKRHVVVDTDGRALLLEPHPASIQDRDGGPLLRASRALYPLIARVFADSGYNPRADRERHEYRRRNRAEDRWPGRLRRSAASMGS